MNIFLYLQNRLSMKGYLNYSKAYKNKKGLMLFFKRIIDIDIINFLFILILMSFLTLLLTLESLDCHLKP